MTNTNEIHIKNSFLYNCKKGEMFNLSYYLGFKIIYAPYIRRFQYTYIEGYRKDGLQHTLVDDIESYQKAQEIINGILEGHGFFIIEDRNNVTISKII